MQPPYLYTHKKEGGGGCNSYFEHIKPHHIALNFSVDWILHWIFHYFVWSLPSGFQLWRNTSCVQELIKNKYHCVRDCLSHLNLGKLSRFANLKMFILHWHCLILSFPTHWKILHWTQIIKAHYPDSLQTAEKIFLLSPASHWRTTLFPSGGKSILY